MLGDKQTLVICSRIITYLTADAQRNHTEMKEKKCSLNLREANLRVTVWLVSQTWSETRSSKYDTYQALHCHYNKKVCVKPSESISKEKNDQILHCQNHAKRGISTWGKSTDYYVGYKDYLHESEKVHSSGEFVKGAILSVSETNSHIQWEACPL